MIPTPLLIGLALGKWWRVVIPAATIGWVLLLVQDGSGSGLAFAASSALIGVINVTVGVLVCQAVRLSLHRVFRSDRQAARS